MSNKFDALINHYDIIINKMSECADEALECHSTEPMIVQSEIAAMIEMKLKAALITLKIP